MSRVLKSWSKDDHSRRRLEFTLLKDFAALSTGAGRKRPPMPRVAHPRRPRLSWGQLQRLNPLLAIFPRFELEIVGRDALVGVETPLIFAANEAGALDQQILRLALPRALRPSMRALSRALTRGRTVAVFSDDPRGGRLVGEFSTIAAELATQHSVSIVPVGIVGSYRLADTLKLRLHRRPKVSVRFGSPVRVRALSIEQITREIQTRVESLVGEGDLSWWEVEQRRLGAPPCPRSATARWLRLWDQAAPRDNQGARRIWK